MTKYFVMCTMVLVTGVSAFAQSKNDSFICTNPFKEIDSRGYFHYVFETKALKAGKKVVVVDYSNNYNKIPTTVTADSNSIVLENASENFQLVIDLKQKLKSSPGFGDGGYVAYITHRNMTDYQISCMLSGEAVLE